MVSRAVNRVIIMTSGNDATHPGVGMACVPALGEAVTPRADRSPWADGWVISLCASGPIGNVVDTGVGSDGARPKGGARWPCCCARRSASGCAALAPPNGAHCGRSRVPPV
nr:hypothetical protein GCM10020241_18230 [Streptoalloteichus tenebrarius]